tara:strand:- start:942 stop:1160 length:219 start_codon:yes stop_codon:yes gene_type:complete
MSSSDSEEFPIFIIKKVIINKIAAGYKINRNIRMYPLLCSISTLPIISPFFVNVQIEPALLNCMDSFKTTPK